MRVYRADTLSIGALMKSSSPATKIVGCSPQNSPVHYESIEGGRNIDLSEKLTGLEPESITFEVLPQSN
ncbi:MAG: hypothetical protein ACRD4I_15895 [Candidatus Angelobacter sp.]